VLTDTARPVLKGEEKVMLREDAARPAASARTSRAAPGAATGTPSSGDPLFEALRDWRRAEAQGQAVPAYVIFQDRTLAEIAAARPRTLDQLGAIPGVGRTKLERYGAAVLRLIGEAG
jgi:ATP-dependent DNA helicase RecQ